MQVDFYQLGSRPVEQVLPRIAERLVESGARLLVVSGIEAQLALLDNALWGWKPDSFLPHAIADGVDDAGQPILLSFTPEAPNGARNIALIDGQWRDQALDFDRAFHFFDGETVEAARAAWRGLNDREGVERRYWALDDDGKWSQMA
ncbi:DNA polymerase III subunit chi [Sphingobium boeckii]|uniref:DNA polymerase-3 subunit chi n=1 Tax=Sphingobium boeckii TaxID=1082345 RepID=A0A7W9AKJ8_9SPHN|nr:DNA polymerase III subunit chi [Sphingobium boeckii]MBB5687360.1 DNA polymerase-3 subunit chi [Sphingobium boeckii]